MSEPSLIEAVLRKDAEAVGTALTDWNAIEQVDREGRTALHSAVLVGSEEIAALLIDQGADVNVQDREGWSPLHFAAQDYQLNIAERLLAAGADVDSIDSHGNTPLWRAVFASRGRPEMIRLLMRRCADREKKNEHGVSPHDLAETISNFDVIAAFKSR